MQSGEDWWPTPLAHVGKEKPWDSKHVVVAEVKSFDEQPHAGQRTTFSALIPFEQIETVRANLANFDTEVRSSGPHPSPYPGSTYNPKFWIAGSGLPKFEPLVVSWRSHDKTVLMPSSEFLMTYGLSPRNVRDGLVHWDDPAAPTHDVVQVLSPSVWDFPLATTAQVSIAREYLQDYLSLRNAALVQVFWEIRWGQSDKHIEKLLGKDESVEHKLTDRTYQFNRDLENRRNVAVQVWGARLVASPGKFPISEDSLEKEGLSWPGFVPPITDDKAMAMNTSDVVYVRDTVLADYEGRPGFTITPESGGVSFGTQWGVGFCERVGRDLIRLELKKLYEGVPAAVTRHWHKFAVDPIPRESIAQARAEPNVAKRAKRITYALVELGEQLANLGSRTGLADLGPEDYVSLRREALIYSGWWSFAEPHAISRHIPRNCSIDYLLERSESLAKLAIEGLSQRHLRRLLESLSSPSAEIKGFGTLKLLDLLVRMSQVATNSGLNLSKDGAEIFRRLKEEGTKPEQPITQLFALYEIRLLKAHRTTSTEQKLDEELRRFGISGSTGGSGYGDVLDKIYDKLAGSLEECANKIAASRTE